MPPVSRTHELIAAMNADGVAFTRRHLISRFGRAAFDDARESGWIVSMMTSVWAHRSHASSLRTRATAAAAWMRPHEVVSGLAACALHGLDAWKVKRVTIALQPKRRVASPPWVRIRRLARPTPATAIRGCPVADLPHALVQTWWDEGSHRGRGLILDAVREDRVTATQIRDAMKSFAKIGRRRELAAFLSRLREGIHSYMEWLADTTILNTPDLCHLERQVEFRIDGAKHVVDAYDRETRTAFEFDGAKYHSNDAARRRDIARDRALATIGVQVLRFTFEEVTEDPGGCRRAIRRTVAARLAHSGFGG